MSDNDTLYLPEELLEWMELQKSELLAWVLERRPNNDISFEAFEKFQELIPEILQIPDAKREKRIDGKDLVFLRKQFLNIEKGLHGIVVAVKVVVENQENEEVLLPILFVPTRKTDWATEWFDGAVSVKPLLH